ncbi:Predicted acetyltransferase [Sinosporangium album]|uniref:Predicted acetyltransferase n=1 Tax=Sinosporangium album TaxID=504805 RepID=A0A1G7T8I1_9ACTN|nr:GNAT family N-acetyltransferase [Sinosporangium album]SDG31595.1 Predicted acetyltransferase [Sinosporangium album]
MSYPIRPMTESDWDAFCGIWEEAFSSQMAPENIERFRKLIELDRTLAAFDGDRMVGCTAIFSFEMTVPGGVRPVAGVTAVGVLPSHRRRGVLSALMKSQLTDLYERGEPVAALYASESSIYGRFGYGLAAEGRGVTIDSHHAAFGRHVLTDPALRLRVADPAEARPLLEKVFDKVRVTRPGMYGRSPGRWDDVLADEESAQRGMGPLRCVVVEDDTAPRGYALFRVKLSFDDHVIADSDLWLLDLFATDPAAYAATWRAVLDRDLVARVKAHSRPADDPIQHLLADQRRLKAVNMEDLWIRTADVRRALAARAYAAPVDVVIEVEDSVCPWNAGRWRLSADTSGAVCEPTVDPADVTLPVAALGEVYLGGRSLSPWKAIGAADEATTGALRALSTAMSWDVKPWAGLIF